MAVTVVTAQTSPDKRVLEVPYLGQTLAAGHLVLVRSRIGSDLGVTRFDNGVSFMIQEKDVVPLNKGDQIILTQED